MVGVSVVPRRESMSTRVSAYLRWTFAPAILSSACGGRDGTGIVPRVTSVSLNSASRNITVGQSFSLVATVNGSGNIARTVTFTSANPDVARITATDGVTATVLGVAHSSTPTTITARADADPTKQESISLTVTGTVRIPSVSPSPVDIRVGQQVKLVPTVEVDPGVSSAVTFTPQNVLVATVSGDGTVTGVGRGQTTVTVRAVADPNVSVVVPVNVRSGVLSVSLTPDQDTLRPTETTQLGVTVRTDPGVSQAAILQSANPAVVTVDANARVTAVAIGDAYVRAISQVDPTVADSTLIRVVDPCYFPWPLQFGVAFNGVITDASCGGRGQGFAINASAQTALKVTLDHQFPATMDVGYIYGTPTGPTSIVAYVVVAPGSYFVGVDAPTPGQRGAFSLLAAVNPTHATLCNTIASTGITVQLQLNACGFQPAARPAGTYRSYSMVLLSPIKAGERVTITVTASGFTPLIEARLGSFPPITATAAPGSNTAIQSFVGQGDPALVLFSVSSVDPGQSGTFSVKVEGPPSG